MHSNQQLWLAWAAGEITDDDAQAAAEAQARERASKKEISEGNAFSEPRPPETSAPRAKVFGPGRLVPLDRNGKARIMMLARALTRRTEPGKAYGAITAKALAVLQALLWGFHNAASGKCFPSYEAIAERAGCARSTVAEAIRALERAGLLTWMQRLKRVREYVPGLFGKTSAWCWRVKRSSNAYVFNDPLTKSDSQTRTSTQGEARKAFASNGPSWAPAHNPEAARAQGGARGSS